MVVALVDEFRVLIDANVLVAGTIWPRWPYEVVQHAVKGHYRLVLTARIIQEAAETIAQIEPDFLDIFIETLHMSDYEEMPTPSDAELSARINLIRDPKDVHVALAAMNARVDCLVTNDKDLTERYEANQALHDRVEVVLPPVFLRDYMGWSSQQLEQIRARNWLDIGTG